MKLTAVALFSAAGVAVAKHHAHQHRHNARIASPVERDVTPDYTDVIQAVETVYVMDGQLLTTEQVDACLASGACVIVGDTLQSVSSTPPSSTPVPTTSHKASSSSAPPTTSSSSSSAPAAEFYEKPVSTVSSSSSSSSSPPSSSSAVPTSIYVAPTTSSTSKAAPTTTAAATSSSSGGSSSGSSGTGIDKEFPSGTLPCSTFPSDYGAVYNDYLGLDGWIGIQQCSGYTSSSTSISDIVTKIEGGCTKDSFCSYACPAGYQKSQWPSAQGATGQSIGGLFCNSKGYLELSRPEYTTLCQAGVGGVTISNELSKVVSVCRTDYPGLESETVPLVVEGGATADVCNPDVLTNYIWEGAYTTAQYYINPSGYGASDACLWGESGTNLGNWAPVNMGLGRSSTGITYLSLFPNSPTNPDGVLDFDIEITGGVSGPCSYSGGVYTSNGVESSTGCTITVTGDAVVTFKSS